MLYYSTFVFNTRSSTNKPLERYSTGTTGYSVDRVHCVLYINTVWFVEYFQQSWFDNLGISSRIFFSWPQSFENNWSLKVITYYS